MLLTGMGAVGSLALQPREPKRALTVGSLALATGMTLPPTSSAPRSPGSAGVPRCGYPAFSLPTIAAGVISTRFGPACIGPPADTRRY
ncbi:hypothetical protein OHA59_34190 [Streptomyces sp. NBC_01589]|uniref:hypothetical protein n=1 Tax=Streptomyces sp. NBC_01589 TaxID=2975886 RepID=UPI00386BB17B